MNISYENKINLAFDKPLTYKGIFLYPATLPFYSLFAAADECLDVSRIEERDINFLRLPYLEYIYEKSLKDEGFKNKWNLLICILKIVLTDEQPFDIVKEEGKIYIKVHQRSEHYELLNKELSSLNEKFIEEHKERKATKEELIKHTEIIKDLKDKMYNIITIGSEDFESIRQLIMTQNDIKSQHYDTKTEMFLNQMKEKLKQTRHSNNDLDLEDLITIVSYSTGIKNEEMYEMTIRRFNRYLNIALKKDDFYLYKQAELSGNIKLKSEVSHWISHYKPKGKFDDIIVENSSMFSELGDKNKI